MPVVVVSYRAAVLLLQPSHPHQHTPAPSHYHTQWWISKWVWLTLYTLPDESGCCRKQPSAYTEVTLDVLPGSLPVEEEEEEEEEKEEEEEEASVMNEGGACHLPSVGTQDVAIFDPV